MEQIILNIRNKRKMPFLKELLKHMEFVEIVEPAEKKSVKKKKILSDLDEAVKQVTHHKKGKLKLKTIREVLNEL